MKKILFGCMMMFAVCSAVNVNAQDASTATSTTRVKYWYYPSSNVYFNDATGDYWYFDQPTTTWMDVKTLPSTYVISEKTPRYSVWHNGSDVWKDNSMHLKKYKVKKNGRVKMKQKKKIKINVLF